MTRKLFFASFLMFCGLFAVEANAQTALEAGHRYDFYQSADGKLRCGLFSARGNLVKDNEIHQNCPVREPEWEVYTLGDGSTAARCVVKGRTGILVETIAYGDYMGQGKRCDDRILYYKWYHYKEDVLPRCGRWARLSHEQQHWVYEVSDRANCERYAK